MIKVGIIGAAGYTGGELLRLIINHPNIEIGFLHSNSKCSMHVSSVHRDLIDCELEFTKDLSIPVDVLFMCMGHGQAKLFLQQHPAFLSQKIIDLSSDFRITDANHHFVYALPEIHSAKIINAKHLANPGCFATAIQLAVLPLAQAQCLNELHIHAITGSTGAGQGLSENTHFSWRNNNVSVYKAFEHQHLNEIGQTLRGVQHGFNKSINFVPMRGNFSRGILASIYLDCSLSENDAYDLFSAFYSPHPFVHLSEESIHLKQIVNTNHAILQIKKHGEKLHIICALDNLLKGAAGQALQNFNLMFGLDQKTGLNLKASSF